MGKYNYLWCMYVKCSLVPAILSCKPKPAPVPVINSNIMQKKGEKLENMNHVMHMDMDGFRQGAPRNKNVYSPECAD